MSKKIKLVWDKEKELSHQDKDMLFKISNFIVVYNEVSGKEIAKHFNIHPALVRKYIQLYRENANTFIHKGYLIATTKGYKITFNKKELKTYHHKLKTMTHSKVKQLDQLNNAIER